MKAIQVSEFGGPEVLKVVEVPSPSPQKGEAIVKQEAIGLNYIDVYHRSGLYKNNLPLIPGVEGAGVVTEVGPGVTEVKPGDRVAYCMHMGSYQEYVAVPAWKLVPLPGFLSTKDGAVAMLQGLTADYLVHGSFELKAGHTALVHAAAGGVGLLLVQVAKKLGATVIGTTSTEEKAKLVKKAGADHVILYTKEDFQAETMKLTGGKGCEVVYDSVGKTTIFKSLECLKVRGTLVTFGQASGPVPPIETQLLVKGSYFLTRPTLGHYTQTREELLERSRRLFALIESGTLKLTAEHEFPLAQAGDAHRLLESRKSTGKVLLTVEH